MKGWTIVLFSFIVGSALGTEKVDRRLTAMLQRVTPDQPVLAWVFFTDKGSNVLLKSTNPSDLVSERSLRRRLKVRSLENIVDETDLPVQQEYVQEVASRVQRVRQVSKWFNGASVQATRRQIEELAFLPFVRRIEPVARFTRNLSEEQVEQRPSSRSIDPQRSRTSNFDYGPSFGQLNQINVPAIHEMGNYGQGVLIGVFDNGFRLLSHEAFDTLRTRIVATYDFVDRKVSVIPNNPSPSFGAHGVVTLSALGGFRQGQLIGPAFGADFLLARTENDSSETPLEEDNWVAAIEWADSLGVDVTSTSLGYLTYDPPYTSWSWEDMDGNTTVITRAADMAVARGIVVCNSAGNNGFHPQHNTLNAPADGDSVLAIGAVESNGKRASFSSVGPTTSHPPRIKPDLMAQGVAVRAAHPDNPSEYVYSGGTSLSCPLAAGVVALLLHAKPSATPMEIAGALKRTASRADSPDNQYGWGIINALAALRQLQPPVQFALLQNYPNPFNLTTTIEYDVPALSVVTITIHDVLGRNVKQLVNEPKQQARYSVIWDGTDSRETHLASGVYIARMVGVSSSGQTFRASRKMVLLK